MRRLFPLLMTVLVAVAAPATGSAQNPRLLGSVGPGFTISLTLADGGPARQLSGGTYDVVVEDRSAIHNFHLTGPGVDMRTDVEFVGTVTWTVSLTGGSYVFVCDPHSQSMRGTFDATAAQPPVTTAPREAPKQEVPTRLTGTVGPGFTISLHGANGRDVRFLPVGLYTILVRDRSRIHNFHLTGPGVNRRTGVNFMGVGSWRVRIAKGKTYRFVCDPHRRTMKGSFQGR